MDENLYLRPINVEVTYNAFNKVETVTKGIAKLSITYGPNRQRTKTELIYNSTTTTTLYADNYEQRTKNGTTTTYHYVASPDGLVAVYIKPKSATKGEMYYIETDHLGSIVRIYDFYGDTKFSASYDAWGNQTISTNAISLSRGYTGHEHWNQFGLIDMNGRFYDPLLGRFLSPDPYVQMPENPQNFNRYSYCLNNPLKYTDPSGEFWHIVIGAAIGGTVNWLMHGHEFSWKGFGYFNIGALAGAATAAVGGGMSSAMAGGSFWAGAGGTSAAMSVSSSFASGAAIGAATGAIGGTITEAGNAWMGGATFGQGVLKGFIGGNIGGLAGGILGGIGGGISAVSDGRDFWNGARYDEFVINQSDIAISGSTIADDAYLKDRIYSEFKIKEGDYNINRITTKAEGKYKLTENGVYKKSNGRLVAGYNRYHNGVNEIHISPYYTNADVTNFRAVAGHELIHAYHHYTYGVNYVAIFSETVAHKYTFDTYYNAGYIRNAINSLGKALELGYYGQWPFSNSYYSLPSNF